MFAARALAVTLSSFVLIYCALSLTVCLSWRRIWNCKRQHSTKSRSDLLFFLRLLPLLAAIIVTSSFVVPSFFLFEPRGIVEPIGIVPYILSLFGLILTIIGALNTGLAVSRASRIIQGWVSQAESVEVGTSIPVLRTAGAAPPLVSTGILRFRILFSEAAACLLNQEELQTALRHEVAHARHRDNLKKLILRFVTFPSMHHLERTWLEALEMAADDSAVSSRLEALDLASALIKLSALERPTAVATLSTALVNSSVSSMNTRIERLITWSGQQELPGQKHFSRYWVYLALALVAGCGITYSGALVRVHVVTEWLVR